MIRSPLAAEFVLSPNVDARQGAARPSILLLHYTGMSSAEVARDWLCAPKSKVSCHYLVDEAGRITQMVDEELRAWHAGLSSWQGQSDINSLSIGIEIHNPGHHLNYKAFPAQQMTAVVDLCRDVITRHGIAARHVLAHSDVAPLRKIDPGELFDWRLLHESGIGHYVEPDCLSGGPFLQQGDSGQPVEALQGMLRMYGYGIEASGQYDAVTTATVRAFQRHFRPARVDGVADTSTVATLHRLLVALPPDQGLAQT